MSCRRVLPVLILAGASALADCHDVTERILLPLRERVAEVERAAEAYREAARGDVVKLRDEIAKLRGAEPEFAAAADAVRREAERRIALWREGIAAARASAQKQIEGWQRSQAKERASKSPRQHVIDRLQNQIDRMKQRIAAKEIVGNKTGLRPNTVAGYERMIEAARQNAFDRVTAFEQGEAKIRVAALGNRLRSWNQIQREVQAKEQALTELLQRKATLPGVGEVDWEQLTRLLDERKAELEGAQARIAAGTYDVDVPGVGRTTRNAVQAKIRAAERELRELRQAYAEGTHPVEVPGLGAITGGELRARRAALAHAAQEAEGGRVEFEGLGALTKQQLEARISRATKRGEAETAARLRAALEGFDEARQAFLAEQSQWIAEVDAQLEAHRAAFRAELETRQAAIDARQPALDATPCSGESSGTEDPRAGEVRKHRLAAQGQGYGALDDYDDWIYAEDDGTVHGDPELALKRALGEPVPGPTGDRLLLGAKALLNLKNYVEYFTALKDAGLNTPDFVKAQREIKAFIDALEALDPAASNFHSLRKALRREHLAKLQHMIESGFLSQARIQRLIDGLKASGSTSRKAKQTLQQLEGLRQAARYAGRALPRLEQVLDALKATLKADVLAASSAIARQSVGSLAERVGSGWKSMSGLDRALVGLSVLAAAAETYERVSKGQDPFEAAGRSTVNLVVELAIAGCPLTLAAEVTSQLVLFSGRLVTGDPAWGEATFNNVTKFLVEKAIVDPAAGAARWAGEMSVVLPRMGRGELSVDDTLKSVDKTKLADSIRTVEGLLDGLEPGHPDEARLLRSRRALRQLLRAK